MKMARQQLPASISRRPTPAAGRNAARVAQRAGGGDCWRIFATWLPTNKLMSAMEEAFHALQYAPTYLPLHIQIANLLIMEGRTQAAVDKLLLVADLYALRGESGQAIRLFNRIIEIAPMDLSVRSRMIDLLLSQGKTDVAVQQYINLAEIYYQLAELDMARQTYTTALKVTQQTRGNRAVMVQMLYRIADIDMQRLDLRNAMRIYEQIRTLEPEDVHGRARLVDLSYRMGQEPAALNEVDGFLALLENSSKREKAIEFLEEVLTDQNRINRKCANVWRWSSSAKGKRKKPCASGKWSLTSCSPAEIGPGAISALQAMMTLIRPMSPIIRNASASCSVSGKRIFFVSKTC